MTAFKCCCCFLLWRCTMVVKLSRQSRHWQSITFSKNKDNVLVVHWHFFHVHLFIKNRCAVDKLNECMNHLAVNGGGLRQRNWQISSALRVFILDCKLSPVSAVHGICKVTNDAASPSALLLSAPKMQKYANQLNEAFSMCFKHIPNALLLLLLFTLFTLYNLNNN